MADFGFETQVFPDEIADIRARRAVVGEPSAHLEDTPRVANGLMGLAISGGGVRSASFALGVVQALAQLGLLTRIDYLSTVSGGGFLGSCVSALLHREGPEAVAENFPLAHPPGRPEPPALAHVRAHAGYLAPEGALDKLRIPSLLVRGLLVNLFIFLPLLLLAVVATDAFYDLYTSSVRMRDHPQAMKWLLSTSLSGFGLFTVVALLYPAVAGLMRGRLRWSARNRMGRVLAGTFFAAGALLALVPFAGLTMHAIVSYPDEAWAGLQRDGMALLSDPTFLTGLGVFVVLVGLLLYRYETLASMAKVLALYPIGLIGPILLYVAYLLMCLYAIDPSPHWHQDNPAALIQVSAPLIPVMAMAGLVLGLFVLWLYNVNITSLHGFYRDRLSRAWLIAHTEAGDRTQPPDHIDDLLLSELAGEGSAAPYHLINAAANTSQTLPRLHGKTADFFLFSKRWIGGPQTGWCRTKDMEALSPTLNLGTALAISGAAAAPQMGSATIRPLAFLLALLNVRMGYWIPHPGRAATAAGLERLLMLRGPGVTYLIREALGRLRFDHSHLYVSDGGHIENLGVYELIRRRCRTIIAIDAEQDEGRHCPSLLDLVRFARVDLGIEIDIDLAPVAGDPKRRGRSERHWTMGSIHYGDGEIGTLIYLKATLTGEEPDDLLDHHRRSPAFPHDTTADQFFTPDRFEAYRALGKFYTEQALDAASKIAGTLDRADHGAF